MTEREREKGKQQKKKKKKSKDMGIQCKQNEVDVTLHPIFYVGV
jgi:hypothetical protein